MQPFLPCKCSDNGKNDTYGGDSLLTVYDDIFIKVFFILPDYNDGTQEPGRRFLRSSTKRILFPDIRP